MLHTPCRFLLMLLRVELYENTLCRYTDSKQSKIETSLKVSHLRPGIGFAKVYYCSTYLSNFGNKLVLVIFLLASYFIKNVFFDVKIKNCINFPR